MAKSTKSVAPALPPSPSPARHSSRRSSFAAALRDAERLLAVAIKKKESAVETLVAMSTEIPRLQVIIHALGGASDAPEKSNPALFNVAMPAPLGEVPDGAGSIPVSTDAAPQPAAAPDINSLPGMEGDWK